MLSKRGVALGCLLVATTAVGAWAATTYQLSTKLATSGGSLTVRTQAAQTSGTVFKNFTTSAAVPVAVSANAGYSIASITKNGTKILDSTVAPIPNGSVVNFVKSTGSTQSLVASFAVSKSVVSSSVAGDAPGTVSPASATVDYNKSVTLTASPSQTNGYVSAITVNGQPYAFTPAAGPIAINLANVTANQAVVATFSALTANAGSNQVVKDAVAAKLFGKASGTAVWSQVSGPATGAFSVVNGATYFTPAGVGTYQLKLAASYAGSEVASSTVMVTSVADVAAYMDNACNGCHNPQGAAPSLAYNNWMKSSHKDTTHGPANCVTCHTDSDMPTAVHASSSTAVVENVCAKCHAYAPAPYNYSIYDSAAQTSYKAPHGAGKAAPSTGAVNVGDSITQYMTNGTTCKDCHGHDNTINAGFAEGGHGAVSSEPLNAFAHYDWSGKTNNGTRQNGNCDRCHTAVGFIKFANQDAALQTRLALVAGQPNNVLVCVSCHKTAEGELRTDAVPSGNGGPLSGGYFALFSSSTASITAGNTKIQVAFPGMKNSSVCVPCHSGRSTDKVFIEIIKKAAAVNGNYSTIGTSYYQHAANMGQTFIGKGGYDFTGQLATVGISAHAAVGMASDKGPCVGCHYTKVDASHSLEVNAADASCVKCHTAAPDVAAAKANFDAGVAVLTALAHAKLDPLRATAQDLSAERANVRFGRFGKAEGTPADATTAIAAYGAWYNWQILVTYDAAAYAHNPAYARQLLNDTVDFLDDGVNNASAAATIAAAAPTYVNGPVATNALGCIDCHAIARDAGAGFVQDNAGVRAVVAEFTKRSHHITGAAPTDAQCAVCHLEGQSVNGKIVVNGAFHMKDAKIYLRDVDNASGVFAWDGVDHTAMDNFCFACHDNNGASDTVSLNKLIPAATASNPFNDTLTNGYDQVARTGVVDVKTAFTTTNASHHAVSGQRYKYRFSTAANAAVWAARNNQPMPSADQIAEGHNDLDGNPIEFGEETMTGDFSFPTPTTYATAGKGEGEATLYEANKFVATYIPLGATQNVADNSVLHCGDCHTVGQWKAGSSTSADGTVTSAVIGAHGSANEYLLRNSLGTDALHNSLTYVCFNCHKAGLNVGSTGTAGVTAGFGLLHPVQNKNQVLGYATAHAVSAFHIQCQADSADNTGTNGAFYQAEFGGGAVPNRLVSSWEPDKVKAYDYLPAANATAALPATTATGSGWLGAAGGSDNGSGNITGIGCTNCHNSALRSSFGGIHGGDNTYTDGLGRVQKSYRFMPGMGNYRYAPPGGWDGKDVSDQRFVVQDTAAVVALRGKPLGGCYTNGAATATGDQNPGYSACNHHGTSTIATYGGGTSTNSNTSTSLTWEPTVREATAGNALVTRPIKY